MYGNIQEDMQCLKIKSVQSILKCCIKCNRIVALLHSVDQTKDLDDETCFHANQFILKPSSKDVLKNKKSVMVPVFKVQEKFP